MSNDPLEEKAERGREYAQSKGLTPAQALGELLEKAAVKDEIKRVRHATRKQEIWHADLEDYAVFPGDMRDLAEELGVVEDILFESGDQEKEKYLLTNLDEPLTNFFDVDAESITSDPSDAPDLSGG